MQQINLKWVIDLKVKAITIISWRNYRMISWTLWVFLSVSFIQVTHTLETHKKKEI